MRVRAAVVLARQEATMVHNGLNMKGKFITLYGINNMGKTTHAKRLVERIRGLGMEAEYVKYPVYDVHPSGDFINSVLRHPEQKQNISEDELQMWYVINRYQFEPQLVKWLEEGVIVIAEDYSGTGIAWGTAKGLEQEWVEMINAKVLKEDLAILIEGNRVLSAREDVHIHEQDDDLMERCKQVHSDLADKYGWKRVELKETPDETANDIWHVVQEFLGV